MQHIVTLRPPQQSSTVAKQFRPGSRVMMDRERQNRMYVWSKRGLDIVICVVALTLLAPILLLISLAVALDSRGPIIFSQDRVGSRRSGKGRRLGWKTFTFRVHKFRTMVNNADQTLHQEYIKKFVTGELNPGEGDEHKFKLDRDPRITRVGRFLRHTSLDELPQLFNILKGEMSLVGPRPVPVYEVAEYGEPHFERFAAPQGLTGLWQVKGRGNVTFEEMMRMDIEYVRSQSLWQDIKLILLTIPAVLAGSGAK